jgi:hypothetical protein
MGSLPSKRIDPYTVAGMYVPTVVPLVSQLAAAQAWLMSSPSQFPSRPPPDLKSEQWARDYNEIKSSAERIIHRGQAEQTDVARFWEATGRRSIYHGVVRSVATTPGRDVTRNARFMMAVTQANGRCDDRHLRREVSLQLLAADHRDPQW